MIKVPPGRFFSSIELINDMKKFREENNIFPERVFDRYIKEKYNAVYINGKKHIERGYFVFENEKDATFFALKWSK